MKVGERERLGEVKVFSNWGFEREKKNFLFSIKIELICLKLT